METKQLSRISFWQLLIRRDQATLTPWIALRNAIGVTLPLIAGSALNMTASALPMCTGAMIVSFSDSADPYFTRARRMLAASAMVAVAIFIGMWLGVNFAFAVALAAGWAFAAGMLVAVSPAAADLGVVSLVMLVIYSASAQSIDKAFYAGLTAFAGGLLQMALSLGPWPLRRYEPERRILRELFLEISNTAATPATGVIDASEPPPASGQINQAQIALAPLTQASNIEGERYLMILNQAERMRLSLLTLRRLRARMRRENPNACEPPLLDRYFEIYSRMLVAIAEALLQMAPAAATAEGLLQLTELAEEMRSKKGMAIDARFQMDALNGQLRAVIELVSHATPSGVDEFLRREARRPWHLRLMGVFATLRANLSLHSAAFRHAVRLSACIAIAEIAGRGFAVSRPYWLPMTVAIVLKPDYASTFSRGVLRLVGTFAGLGLATVLFHLFPMPLAAQITIIGASMFVMRWIGPANYGIFVFGVSSLIVFLFALSGYAPQEVIAARAVNTIAGGLIALAAYWLWPTWEQTQVRELLANLLDSYRLHFRAVRERFAGSTPGSGPDLDTPRLASRLARSNLEASVGRLSAEPRVKPESLRALHSILATSHRLAHSLMALEAGLNSGGRTVHQEPFLAFANDVELTLYYLAGSLRGSAVAPPQLPDLREDHYSLCRSTPAGVAPSALVIAETDRIVNSVNTLTLEMGKWLELEPR